MSNIFKTNSLSVTDYLREQLVIAINESDETAAKVESLIHDLDGVSHDDVRVMSKYVADCASAVFKAVTGRQATSDDFQLMLAVVKYVGEKSGKTMTHIRQLAIADKATGGQTGDMLRKAPSINLLVKYMDIANYCSLDKDNIPKIGTTLNYHKFAMDYAKAAGVHLFNGAICTTDEDGVSHTVGLPKLAQQITNSQPYFKLANGKEIAQRLYCADYIPKYYSSEEKEILLCCQNGVVYIDDLIAGADPHECLHTYQEAEGKMLRNRIFTDYIPDATSTEIEEWLDELTGGDKGKKTSLLEFAAISLIPQNLGLRKNFMCHGDPKTGKSTYYKFLEIIMNGALGVEDPDANVTHFSPQKFADDGSLASLQNRSLVVLDDIESNLFGSSRGADRSSEAVARLKTATSCEPISIRRPHYSVSEIFTPVANMLFSSNSDEAIRVRADDVSSVSDRFIIHTFNDKPKKRIRHFAEKLAADMNNRSAFINLALKALVDLANRDWEFTITEDSVENKRVMELSSDSVKAFVEHYHIDADFLAANGSALSLSPGDSLKTFRERGSNRPEYRADVLWIKKHGEPKDVDARAHLSTRYVYDNLYKPFCLDNSLVPIKNVGGSSFTAKLKKLVGNICTYEMKVAGGCSPDGRAHYYRYFFKKDEVMAGTGDAAIMGVTPKNSR